jgi:hypothetical protein
MAENKLEMIEARVRDLRRIRDALDAMIIACRKSEAESASCALIETLNKPR